MRKKTKIDKLAKEIKNTLRPSQFDPFGSYTGLTKDHEKPIQDQDDL